MKSFSHGIHPPDNKARTADQPIRRFAFAAEYFIFLSQHAGKPAICEVKEGQEVQRGQQIARADGFMSVPMHSPVTGRVKGVVPVQNSMGNMQPAIWIEAYPAASQQSEPAGQPVETLSRDEILKRIQATGMVGLGGAAFPTHVKFNPLPDAKIDTLVLNGCECEPYLTADHRVMVEYSDLIVKGTRLALEALGAPRAVVGIEDNKMDAVAALSAAFKKAGMDNVSVEAVKTKYPQGAEKMLVKAVLDREIPSGKLPANAGVMVSNVTTLAEIGELVPTASGLIERVITITGEGVEKPGNYIIPTGTPLGFILEEVGADPALNDIIFGGPMMGQSVVNPNTPLTKAVSGILIRPRKKAKRVDPCIRCGWCLQACPIHLNPSQMGLLAKGEEFDVMQSDYHLFDCFECGSCSYVCPSGIPLVQLFRMAKKSIRERKDKP